MTTLVGIDLSVQPADTGVVVVETDAVGRPESVTFDRDRRTTDALRELIKETTTGGFVAVDVPFGWPRLFRKRLGDLPKNQDQFQADEDEGEGSIAFQSLRLRETDQWLRDPARALTDVRNRAIQPLSAATDKLGATTMRWQAIQADLQPSHMARVLECYPAAARAAWRNETEPSASADWLEAPMDEWRSELRRAFHGVGHGPVRSYVINKHERDAYIAAMVASSYVRGRSTCMHAVHPRDARAAHEADAPPPEGCIVLPTESLDAHPLSPSSARADG